MKTVQMLEDALGAIGDKAHPMLKQLGYALGHKESGFNPNAEGVLTRFGKAQGMLQALPGTILDMQKRFPDLIKDPNNRKDQLMAGLLYANESLKLTDRHNIPDEKKAYYAGAMHLSGHGRLPALLKGESFGDKYVNINTDKYGKDITDYITKNKSPVLASNVPPQVGTMVPQQPVISAVPNVAPVMAQAAPVIAPMAQDVPLIQQQLAQLPAPTVLGSNEPKKVTPNDIDFMGQIFGNRKPVDFSPFMLGMSDKANIGGFGGRRS